MRTKHGGERAPEITREDRERGLRLMLEGAIETERKYRAELEADLNRDEPAHTLNRMSWLGDHARAAYEAGIARDILDVKPDEPEKDLVARARYWHERLIADLLRNAYRPCSTGAFHNACELAKGEAATRMVERLAFFCAKETTA